MSIAPAKSTPSKNSPAGLRAQREHAQAAALDELANVQRARREKSAALRQLRLAQESKKVTAEKAPARKKSVRAAKK